MDRRRLPANGTQTNLQNVTNKICIKTAINAQLKKINRAINAIKNESVDTTI